MNYFQGLTTKSTFLLFTVILSFGYVTKCNATGPFYVDPVVAVQPTSAPQDLGNLITQTVYGFLDFTTTIGNTVMIFSPNSAPPPELPKPVTQAPKVQTVVNTVIETKPLEPTTNSPTNKPSDIKPSKTIIKSTVDKKPPPQVSSVVQVLAGSPVVSSVVNIKAVTPEPSSVVHVLSSRVEVISENPPSGPAAGTKKGKSQKAPPQVLVASRVVIHEEPAQQFEVEQPQITSSIVEVLSSSSTDEEDLGPVLVGNQIGEPEYDFLSRQPAEFVEETYRVVNLRPSSVSKFAQKLRPSADQKRPANRRDDTHPTGLVTKLGGTVVKDGVTTVHETSVIGTYISGKYAQVLQSTSHIFQGNGAKPKPTPASSLRILKTAAPQIPKSPKYSVDPSTVSPTGSDETGIGVDALYGNPSGPNLVRSSRRPATSSGSFKNRFRNRNNKDDIDQQEAPEEVTPASINSYGNGKNQKNNRNRNSNGSNGNQNLTPSKPAKNNNRYNRYSTTSSSVELATVSVFSETTPAYSSRRNKISRQGSGYKPTAAVNSVVVATSVADNNYSRRVFKPKVQATPIDDQGGSTSLYKFKLNRTPGRWQYKTTAKPRITIRKQQEDNAPAPSATPPTDFNDIPVQQSNSRSDDYDLDSSSSVNGDVLNDAENDNQIEKIDKKFPIETIKVEISTPADFANIYYEIATIKSPYTFQVGTIKNTRYVTVTSTFEKSFEPEPTITASLNEPLTENILATTSHIDKEHNLLDSSIATLPPIVLSSDAETPPLETLTETFSTTQLMLKTHILPVIRGENTTSYTLIQTYHVTRLVTATKTLPPMEAYQFVPSKTLNEFNSRLDEAGSELHLELEFGDSNENDDDDIPRHELPADLDLSNIGSDFDLSEVDKANLPEGLLRPKKKVNSQPRATTHEPPATTPALSQEQLQQLALLRLFNPGAQIPQVITTSKPVIKLETVYESHVIPIINGLQTSYSTISRAIGTVSKTEYEYATSTLPAVPLPPVNPLNQLNQLNPLFPQQPQQFQITSTPVVTQTVITQTESKVLKLTFGAKTAYTTLFSTKVMPTLLTSYVTQSVPYVQQTQQAFPGYYPAPYPPFPYVG